jgi:hypothetical protein
VAKTIDVDDVIHTIGEEFARLAMGTGADALKVKDAAQAVLAESRANLEACSSLASRGMEREALDTAAIIQAEVELAALDAEEQFVAQRAQMLSSMMYVALGVLVKVLVAV